MPRRVAITIAGAVSLGAYEAGVMFELLDAFKKHNDDCDKNKTPADKIYIDVITGASAGGMTAALLGERLLFDGDSLNGPLNNPLYKTWVERIDIHELVDLSREEIHLKWNSLLSSDLITKIGQEALINSMGPNGASSPPHSTIECDPTSKKPLPLDIGLAITNLDGIDYRLRIVGNDDDGFNYTRSADQELFTLTAADRHNTKLWHRLRDAAVACGAFPAAFRAQDVDRTKADFEPILPDPPSLALPGKTYVVWPDKKPDFKFVYTDGGVLQNQPLGIAKNFVDNRVLAAHDNNDPDAFEIGDDRLYVLVSPHAVESSAQNRLRAKNLTIAGVLAQLFHTYIRQATFHDWIVAEGMNVGIHILKDRAHQLAELIAQGAVPPEMLAPAPFFNDMLLPDSLEHKRTLARLKRQFSADYNCVFNAAGEATAASFIEAIATLEAAADLGDRNLMKIVAVLADGRTELAGSGISSFVGFFSPEFRQHDYWMGRVKARVYLQRQDVKRILKVTQWKDETSWGGADQTGVMKVLKNPTSITQLPLSLKQQLRPGLKSLLHVISIRPAISAVLLIFASAGIIIIIALLLLIAVVLGHVRITVT